MGHRQRGCTRGRPHRQGPIIAFSSLELTPGASGFLAELASGGSFCDTKPDSNATWNPELPISGRCPYHNRDATALSECPSHVGGIALPLPLEPESAISDCSSVYFRWHRHTYCYQSSMCCLLYLAPDLARYRACFQDWSPLLLCGTLTTEVHTHRLTLRKPHALPLVSSAYRCGLLLIVPFVHDRHTHLCPVTPAQAEEVKNTRKGSESPGD